MKPTNAPATPFDWVLLYLIALGVNTLVVAFIAFLLLPAAVSLVAWTNFFWFSWMGVRVCFVVGALLAVRFCRHVHKGKVNL